MDGRKGRVVCRLHTSGDLRIIRASTYEVYFDQIIFAIGSKMLALGHRTTNRPVVALRYVNNRQVASTPIAHFSQTAIRELSLNSSPTGLLY